jgi:stage III sporulation protein AH
MRRGKMSRIHFNRSLKKKTIVLFSMLMVVLAVGAINGRISQKNDLTASKDYVSYEKEMIDEHDGEVLVDSIHLAGMSGSSPLDAEDGETEMESAIVITSDDISDIKSADVYFEEMRATIDMDRGEILSMLTSLIAESDSGPDTDNATKQKLRIIEYMNTEKVIENLIVNKGFSDALVVLTDTSVNVSVNKQELTKSDVAKIMDVVIRETGRSADQIVIQNKY